MVSYIGLLSKSLFSCFYIINLKLDILLGVLPSTPIIKIQEPSVHLEAIVPEQNSMISGCEDLLLEEPTL